MKINRAIRHVEAQDIQNFHQWRPSSESLSDLFRLFLALKLEAMPDQSSVPLLDDGDIESKPVKIVDAKITIASEETPSNTQAFWLLIWMAK